MKKYGIALLMAVMILAQVITVLRITDLQRQVESVKNELGNIRYDLGNKINDIYAGIDSRLREEAALLEDASYSIGTLNPENLMAEVTFSVLPKEVGESTTVSLDIDSVSYPMNQHGTTFSAMIPVDIFKSLSPLIVIHENGIQKTIRDDRLDFCVKHMVLPELHPQLTGSARYGNGTYKCDQILFVNVKDAMSDIDFTDTRLVLDVGGTVISDERIPDDALASGWPVVKNISLGDGQICTMTVIATDSLGLVHRCTAGQWAAPSADAQREPWFDDERIYAPDGTLLWQTEYTMISG